MVAVFPEGTLAIFADPDSDVKTQRVGCAVRTVAAAQILGGAHGAPAGLVIR